MSDLLSVMMYVAEAKVAAARAGVSSSGLYNDDRRNSLDACVVGFFWSSSI